MEFEGSLLFPKQSELVLIPIDTLCNYLSLSILKFQCLAVSLRTTKFNIKKFCIVLALS